jgi:O-antigen ligase
MAGSFVLLKANSSAVAEWGNRGVPRSVEFCGPALIVMIAAAWALSFVFGYQRALLAESGLGLLAALIGIERPFVGILGLGTLATLDSLSRGLLANDGLWRWNTLNFLLLGIIVLHLPSLVRRVDLQHVALLLFISLLALELLVTEDPKNGIQHLLGVASAFGFTVYLLRTASSSRTWYWLGMVNGFLGATGGVLYYLNSADLPYINPNAFAQFPLGAIFSICLALVDRRSAREMRNLTVLAALNVVWVFLSGSRGSLLVAALCGLYIAARVKAIARGKGVLIVLAVLGIAIVVSRRFPGLETNASGRFEKLFDSDRSIANRTSGRSDIAYAGWKIFRSNPLGVGTGGFDVAYSQLDIEGLAFAGLHKQAHSAWVKILAENGIPGIVLLMIFVGSFARAALKTRVRELRGLGFLTTMTLSVAFLSTEFQSKDLWLFAMSVIAVFQDKRRLAVAGSA